MCTETSGPTKVSVPPAAKALAANRPNVQKTFEHIETIDWGPYPDERRKVVEDLDRLRRIRLAGHEQWLRAVLPKAERSGQRPGDFEPWNDDACEFSAMMVKDGRVTLEDVAAAVGGDVADAVEVLVYPDDVDTETYGKLIELLLGPGGFERKLRPTTIPPFRRPTPTA